MLVAQPTGIAVNRFMEAHLIELKDVSVIYDAGTSNEVRAEMAAQKVSATEMARALDCSPATMTRRLNGTTEISIQDLIDICKVLKIRTADVVNRADRRMLRINKEAA